MNRTVTGLRSEALVFASVLLVASCCRLCFWQPGRLGLSARTTTSAHGYRAAPGCVFSLAHPFIAPLKLSSCSLGPDPQAAALMFTDTSYPTAPIHHAAANRDVETLRRLLAEVVSPDATAGPARRTPLHALCANNNAADDRVVCFQLLRDAGANLEATNLVGSTALIYAAENGDAKMVSLLVEAGVNVDAANSSSCTALHFAARGSIENSFFADGATECVKVLLAAGADIDFRARDGRRPFDRALHFYCRRQWPLFLRAGAEIPRAPCENLTHPYIVRVQNAGGFKKYEQAHLARLTNTFEPKLPLLPPELVRHVVSFWLHAGYY